MPTVHRRPFHPKHGKPPALTRRPESGTSPTKDQWPSVIRHQGSANGRRTHRQRLYQRRRALRRLLAKRRALANVCACRRDQLDRENSTFGGRSSRATTCRFDRKDDTGAHLTGSIWNACDSGHGDLESLFGCQNFRCSECSWSGPGSNPDYRSRRQSTIPVIIKQINSDESI
ncbi:unannotated protein [freshwater metagenome]|uniref:Unannotated protein n=1 Tax=freshwater metagenome TaxID=449393 RepID=A0A6J6EP27_9ZZZZ